VAARAAEHGARPRAAGLVALFAALLVLPPVGQRVITTGDEARFTLVARDMLERGTWFEAWVRHKRYRNKPPLYPWSIKLLSLPSGRVSQTAAHLPVALAAVATVFGTALLGQRLLGRRAGVFAGLVLATMYGFFEQSLTLLPDMLVVAFWMAALYAFWASVADPPGMGARAAFYVLIALGVFAKGPLGLVPLLVAGAWLVTEHGWRGLARLWSPWGVFGFAVVSAAWLLPFVRLGGRSFVEKVLVENWLNWYVGGPSARALVNYVGEAAQGLVPWPLLLALALLAARGAWRDGAYRFAFLAWAVPFFVMMLSSNQRVRYLLPSYAGAALLVGWWADRHAAARSRAARLAAWLAPAAVAAAIAALVVPGRPRDGGPLEGVATVALLVAGAVALAALAWHGLRAGRAVLLVGGTAAVMAGLLAVGVWQYNGWVNRTQDYPALAAAAERHARGGEICVFGGRFFSIDVYLGRPVCSMYTVEHFNEFTARPDRPVVVVNGRTWGNIQGQIPPEVRVLETLRIRQQDMHIVRLGP
jgi:4-amino-4-deoxy-L-arabinose transferase-like glycosyltransferase